MPRSRETALSASASAAIKTRRSHRKSRNGCAECKRRHIRCDEHRPVCSNCSIAERHCVYPNTPTAASTPAPSTDISMTNGQPPSPPSLHERQQLHHQHQHPHHHHHVKSPATPSSTEWPSSHGNHSHQRYPSHFPPPQPQPPSRPHSHPSTPQLGGSCTSANTPSISSIAASASNQASFTMQHLVLMHHAETAMDSGGVGPPDYIQSIVDIAMRHSSDAPYLIDQILGFSAFHLSVLYEEAALSGSASSPPTASSPTAACALPAVTNLRNQATELQTRAIANFTRLTSHLAPDDTATSVQRFLFSSIVSLHSLADTLNVLRDDNVDFRGFIGAFGNSVPLHRGVQTVILPIWEYLIESELKPMLSIVHSAMPDFHTHPRGKDCESLLTMVNSASSSPSLTVADKDACRAAIDMLQWCFDMYQRLPYPNTPHAASSFSVTVSTGYVDVLLRLEPEALVILAYYGVLIHRCRRFWLFRDSGARLVRAIANYLGDTWSHILVWAIHVVETETDPPHPRYA